MQIGRRGFLKAGGLALVALATGSAFRVFTRESESLAAAESTPTQRWAMVIDTKACTAREGCRDCITSCHRTHNVPDFGNPKDEVKWLWTSPFGNAFEEYENRQADAESPVLLLCNHCDNPPCARVCPTKATWKREDGIVMMDYHRCIGCRYCMAACPFGARSFNWRDPRPFIKEIQTDYPTRTRGVVEKCNFCQERLAKGLQPVCVEACLEKAMFFGNINDASSEVNGLLRSRFAIRRKPNLGTAPQVYYLV